MPFTRVTLEATLEKTAGKGVKRPLCQHNTAHEECSQRLHKSRREPGSEAVKIRVVLTDSTMSVIRADNWDHCSLTRSADLMLGV